jgi:hypothetical protein
MKDAEHLVSLTDEVSDFVKDLLDYGYGVQLESRELVEDQAEILDGIALLLARLEILPLKLLSEKGPEVPVRLEETFLEGES